MLIKYLKNAPNAKKGNIKQVTDNQANVLIKLGIAKEHKPRKTKTKTDNENS